MIVNINWSNPSTHHAGGGRLYKVETFAGLRVTVLEGDGRDDPYRTVMHYFDETGTRIVIDDVKDRMT